MRCSNSKCSAVGVVHVGVERLRERRAVVGVHAAEPLAAGRADLVLAVAEHALPARGVEDRVGGDVPVPQAVVGAGHRERVALLGRLQLLQRALVGERVADRVLEPVPRQPGDDEEVGDPVRGRLGVGGAVGLVAEDDHGDVRRGLDQLLRQVQPVGAGRVDLAVDEHDVVRRGARAPPAPARASSTCSSSEPFRRARTGA